ncbi:unnamed protein product [Dracunculus medinensis]|uniref:Serine/threonine-protein kinase TOR n=1 Tax=Dracunculus medinensis TaxID=318479 RepID=A0A0N4UIY1_DRAME|nr:unnamed protein product [Dracunculus medinensis]
MGLFRHGNLYAISPRTFHANTANTSSRVQRTVPLDRFRAITLACEYILFTYFISLGNALGLDCIFITCTTELSELGNADAVSKITDPFTTESLEDRVLIDLLLSILYQKRRFHRALVNFIFASIAPNFRSEHINQLIEIINSNGKEVVEPAEYDSESGDEMSYDHNESIARDIDNNETMESGSRNSNIVFEVGDKDNVSSDLSDETMFRMDKKLSTAFRQSFKLVGNMNFIFENSLQFRLKCMDLLLILISHKECGFLAVDLLIPLVKTARESLRKKGNEIILKKSMNLLGLIMKFKKHILYEGKALDLIDKLVEATSQLVNPIIRNFVANLMSFLFSSCYDFSTNSLSEKMRSKVNDLFSKYMKQTNNEILNEIATAPFVKYPRALLSSLKMIIEFAFNENIRIHRRTEAISCAIAFMRKDLLKEAEEQVENYCSSLAKRLGHIVQEYLSKFDMNDGKPRFFAYVIRLITAFASMSDLQSREKLAHYLVNDLNRLCESKALVQSREKIKRFNSASHAVCGRTIMAAGLDPQTSSRYQRDP